MAVLGAEALNRRLNLSISDPKSLVITPLPPPDALSGDSVDLRLGTHFLMPQIPPQPFVDPGSKQESQNYLQLHAPLGGYFVLPAHQTVLGATLEFVKLPCDVSGEILTKSSVARTFMIIETAPWIHPSYRGCLTLEIANASNTAIILYPGMPIGQLILMETTSAATARGGILDRIFQRGATQEGESRKLSGSYIGPVFPEAPQLKSPAEMLKKLGINKYRRPGHGWVNYERLRQLLATLSAGWTPEEKLKVQDVLQKLQDNGVLPEDCSPTTLIS